MVLAVIMVAAIVIIIVTVIAIGVPTAVARSPVVVELALLGLGRPVLGLVVLLHAAAAAAILLLLLLFVLDAQHDLLADGGLEDELAQGRNRLPVVDLVDVGGAGAAAHAQHDGRRRVVGVVAGVGGHGPHAHGPQVLLVGADVGHLPLHARVHAADPVEDALRAGLRRDQDGVSEVLQVVHLRGERVQQLDQPCRVGRLDHVAGEEDRFPDRQAVLATVSGLLLEESVVDVDEVLYLRHLDYGVESRRYLSDLNNLGCEGGKSVVDALLVVLV